MKCKDEYWVFYTGRGVPSYRSRDLVKWERGPAVFKAAPEWIAKVVPENRNMQYWAPDIIKLGDRYLLFYSVSSMGKMTSAIGLATNPTLDPDDPAYHWTDQGFVVRTQDGDGYNAIDPAAFRDSDGSLWMTFGSYWSGIKLIQLDPQTGKRIWRFYTVPAAGEPAAHRLGSCAPVAAIERDVLGAPATRHHAPKRVAASSHREHEWSQLREDLLELIDQQEQVGLAGELDFVEPSDEAQWSARQFGLNQAKLVVRKLGAKRVHQRRHQAREWLSAGAKIGDAPIGTRFH